MKSITKWLTAPITAFILLALYAIGVSADVLHDPTGGVPLLLGVVFGTGVMPATGAIATELTYITRRAFVPKLVVQIYNNSPTIASLLANAQPAYRGGASISVPVQQAAFVSSQ